MHVVLLMANNSSTPYFNRFADLAKNDVQIKLSFICLYPEKSQMIADMEQRGLDCYWIKYDNSKKMRGFINVFFKLLKLYKKIKPDVIHTHLFDDSVPGLFAAKVAGIKKRIISKLDAGFHYKYTPRWVFLDRFNNNNATHIVAVSKENKQFIINKEKADPDKIHLIYQGLPEAEVTTFSKKVEKKVIERFNLNNKQLVLSVARYIDWKGQKEIIKAAHLLKGHNPNLLFLLIGFGDQEEVLKEMVKELELEKIVIIGGEIDREALNALYHQADIFVHAAKDEPFGFVIAEAMFNKIPLVVTNTGAAFENIMHLKSGYLLDNNIPKSIAEGIAYVLNNDFKNQVIAAYSFAKSNFTIDKMWDQHKSLYLS